MWLTLHSVFNQIILCNGDNNYNIKHLSKEKLKQKGQLPNVLDVVDDAIAFDQISIPNTPDTDMDETITFEGKQNKHYERKYNRYKPEHNAYPSFILKLKEYSPYPHASGRVGAMANACPHRCRIVV